MALPSKILMTKTEIVYHLDLPKEKVDKYCVPLEKWPAVEGMVGNSFRYLLREFVKEMMMHVAEHAKGRVADDPKARSELATAVGKEVKNAALIGSYISKAEVVAKQAQKAAIVARSLDSIVPNLKRKHPSIAPAFLSSTTDEIAHARNALADTLLQDVAKIEPVDDLDDLFGDG